MLWTSPIALREIKVGGFLCDHPSTHLLLCFVTIHPNASSSISQRAELISCLLVRPHNGLAEQNSNMTLWHVKTFIYSGCYFLDLCVGGCPQASVSHIVLSPMSRSYWCRSWAQSDAQIESPFRCHSIILSDCLLVSCFLWEDLILPWTDPCECLCLAALTWFSALRSWVSKF